MNLARILFLAILVFIIWAIANAENESELPEQPQQGEPARVVDPPATADHQPLLPVELGSLSPIHKHGEIYLAGQPSPQDIALLKERGFKTILSLRKKSEISWDEAATAEKLGLRFVHAPFQSVDELEPKVFDQSLAVLRNKALQPVLFHCGSAKRVGAIWYAYRVLDGKLSHAEAIAEAKDAGLYIKGHIEKAREYVLATQLQTSGEPQP